MVLRFVEWLTRRYLGMTFREIRQNRDDAILMRLENDKLRVRLALARETNRDNVPTLRAIQLDGLACPVCQQKRQLH